MNHQLGRIVAKYREAFGLVPPPPRAVEQQEKPDRFAEFIEAREAMTRVVEPVERRKLGRRLMDEGEALLNRLRREVELIEAYSAREGLRAGAMARIERLNAEADEVEEALAKIHGKLNPPLINGEEPPLRLRCRYCREEITRKVWWENCSVCEDCANPGNSNREDGIDELVEGL